MEAAFRIPLNLPHAATCAARIVARLADSPGVPAESRAHYSARALLRFLAPFRMEGENPPGAEGIVAGIEALSLARQLVEEISHERLGNDRLGQSIRNLFECLERGEEGASQGLKAGEDPRSIQRPV